MLDRYDTLSDLLIGSAVSGICPRVTISPSTDIRKYRQSRKQIRYLPSGVHPDRNASTNGSRVSRVPSAFMTITSDRRFERPEPPLRMFERPKPPLPPALPQPVRTYAIHEPSGFGIRFSAFYDQ